jgi:hypothetical protein
MSSRLKFGSVRALLTFVGFLVVFGVLVELDKGSRAVGVLWITLWCTFLLIASVLVLIRMWRMRGSPDEFWKSAHRGGQIGVLPPKWRRWVLGEDD